MAKSSRWLPIGLVVFGATLIVVSLLILLITLTPEGSGGTPYPARLLGRQPSALVKGKAATTEFSRLHNKTIRVEDGIKAVYGPAADFTLWVSENRTVAETSALLADMQDKIAAGDSPFSEAGTFSANGTTVYALEGMGQSHFYFQSRRYIVWLAAIPAEADAAIQEVLDFYR